MLFWNSKKRKWNCVSCSFITEEKNLSEFDAFGSINQHEKYCATVNTNKGKDKIVITKKSSIEILKRRTKVTNDEDFPKWEGVSDWEEVPRSSDVPLGIQIISSTKPFRFPS